MEVEAVVAADSVAEEAVAVLEVEEVVVASVGVVAAEAVVAEEEVAAPSAGETLTKAHPNMFRSLVSLRTLVRISWSSSQGSKSCPSSMHPSTRRTRSASARWTRSLAPFATTPSR